MSTHVFVKTITVVVQYNFFLNIDFSVEYHFFISHIQIKSKWVDTQADNSFVKWNRINKEGDTQLLV